MDPFGDSSHAPEKKEWKGPVFLTPSDISAMLNVSRVWVYKLCDQGIIPFFRLAGKVIRFKQEEIEQWMEESRGEKYRRDKGLGDARGRGPAGLCASSGGENNRAPDTKTGARNQPLEMIM